MKTCRGTLAGGPKKAVPFISAPPLNNLLTWGVSETSFPWPSLPHPAAYKEQVGEQKSWRIQSSAQRLARCRGAAPAWLMTAFHAALPAADTKRYPLMKRVPAGHPLYIIVLANQPIHWHKTTTQAVKLHATTMNERGLWNPRLQ